MALNHSDAISSITLLQNSPTPFSFLNPITPWHLQNHNNSPSDNILSNRGGAMAGAAILGLVFLLGVPGNLFIIWSILVRARRRSITTLLILNLAFADGFLMLLTPFFIIYLFQRSWVFGLLLCQILFFLCCTNMYASIFLIMLMSLHRLIAILWPKRVGAMTERKTIMRLLVVVWILALGLSTPVLFFRTITKGVKEPQSLVCHCQHPTLQLEVIQYSTETLLGFLLPYGLIIGSYTCILRRIRKTRFRRRIRSEKLILVIVVTFGIFWLPYHIINLVQVAAALHPEGSSSKAWLQKFRTNMRALTSTIAFVSSSVNPVLYTFAGKSYIRREGMAFMARLFEGTAMESTRKIRRSNQNSRERDRETDDCESFKDKDFESVSPVNAISVLKELPEKNGK
ncbi:hypothetical protein DNTS_004494 [Danionella cerebrum]|uniref:G-protein coupled receptors family 1 profile domain-containing protein n=1 Tax=Danionella cerebrum TaxID=2873325 RepID=A0A553REH8_9TELE|nr:hypothetical protein DNTS_004494 [Danionella translucida]